MNNTSEGVICAASACPLNLSAVAILLIFTHCMQIKNSTVDAYQIEYSRKGHKLSVTAEIFSGEREQNLHSSVDLLRKLKKK